MMRHILLTKGLLQAHSEVKVPKLFFNIGWLMNVFSHPHLTVSQVSVYCSAL